MGYKTDIDFAKRLITEPLQTRMAWLEAQVYEQLKVENVSVIDYDEVMGYINNLRGGIKND